MTQLYLVRHGETDWNAARRVQGISDIPLNETGRQQAHRVGGLFASGHWDAIYTSPLSRAQSTAQIIAGRLGMAEVTPHPGLVERDYGDAEGLTLEQIEMRYPDGVPGQEDRDRLARRMLVALSALANKHPDGRLIVVSHGGAIRAVLNTVDPAINHPAIRNTSVHSFSWREGEIRLVTFDDPLST